MLWGAAEGSRHPRSGGPLVSDVDGTPWKVPEDFARDLVAALSELPNPIADQTAQVATKTGGSYKYHYPKFAGILDQVRPILGRHHIGVLQAIVPSAPGTIGVVTRIQHEGGTYVDFGPLVLPAVGDAQAHGGAITYARRYALCAVLGIAADEDTDGKPKTSQAGDAGGTVTPREAEGRSGGSEAAGEGVMEPPGQPSGNATPEQWARASRLGFTQTDVLRELQKIGIDVRKKADVTAAQLSDLLRAFP